jgi:hypothetical protein
MCPDARPSVSSRSVPRNRVAPFLRKKPAESCSKTRSWWGRVARSARLRRGGLDEQPQHFASWSSGMLPAR